MLGKYYFEPIYGSHSGEAVKNKQQLVFSNNDYQYNYTKKHKHFIKIKFNNQSNTRIKVILKKSRSIKN